jgi:plasmid stabilization system protein ParE
VSLVIRPAAAEDLEQAYRWYERQRAGLGGAFLDSVQVALTGIHGFPEGHPVVYRDTRRCPLRRFPYFLFYRRVDEDIVVVACFHGHRDPRVLRVRVPRRGRPRGD